MRAYKNKAVADLAKQLTAGLLRLRKGYVDAAEAFLQITEPEREYPYELVVYRLTGYRPRRREPLRPLGGKSLQADLQKLILDICDSLDLPAEAYAEGVHDTHSLARRLRVSTKTIQRWRRGGLVARRLLLPDGKKRICFLESSVRHFAERRRWAMLRSARFSQMGEPERADIIRRAKRIVSRTGSCLHEVSKRLAARTGRAVETIRYTIRKHDQDNPADAVYAGHSEPLDAQAREVVYRCFLHGVPVTSLARRYQRTRGSIYRVINEMRARQLMTRKIDYVYNPQFDLPGADQIILGEAPAEEAASTKTRAQRPPGDLPPYLRCLYELPLLRPEQERHLFRQYNYLKYRADRLRKKLDLNHIRSAQLRQIERILAQAEAVKNQIIRANLRLVVSIAKKHLAGPQGLFELISDGIVSLIRAVERFDYSRGFKLSTYASWAIMKNFARSVPKERYLLDHFVTSSEEILDLVASAGRYDPRATSMLELRESIQTVLAQLSPRERSIVVRHFGLNELSEPQTLDQLSRSLGISKERVRQIEQRAMQKLRAMLEPVRADLMR